MFVCVHSPQDGHPQFLTDINLKILLPNALGIYAFNLLFVLRVL